MTFKRWTIDNRTKIRVLGPDWVVAVKDLFQFLVRMMRNLYLLRCRQITSTTRINIVLVKIMKVVEAVCHNREYKLWSTVQATNRTSSSMTPVSKRSSNWKRISANSLWINLSPLSMSNINQLADLRIVRMAAILVRTSQFCTKFN